MPIDLHTTSTGLPGLNAVVWKKRKKKKQAILKPQWKEHGI